MKDTYPRQYKPLDGLLPRPVNRAYPTGPPTTIATANQNPNRLCSTKVRVSAMTTNTPMNAMTLRMASQSPKKSATMAKVRVPPNERAELHQEQPTPGFCPSQRSRWLVTAEVKVPHHRRRLIRSRDLDHAHVAHPCRGFQRALLPSLVQDGCNMQGGFPVSIVVVHGP